MNRASLVVLVIASLAGCAKISRSEWIDKFEPKMVEELCKPTQYFRTCYDVDDATCRTIAKAELHTCVGKATIPESLDQKAGETAGAQIGECAGEAIETKLRADKHTFHAENKACSDPNAWGGK